jgi:hypothetical protein
MVSLEAEHCNATVSCKRLELVHRGHGRRPGQKNAKSDATFVSSTVAKRVAVLFGISKGR